MLMVAIVNRQGSVLGVNLVPCEPMENRLYSAQGYWMYF